MKVQLSEEEMEQRREEMMANAKWREEQREKKRRRYEAEENDEEERNRKKSGEAADFIRPMLARATETSTVEARIRSNRHRIQRAHGHMDESFVRK